MLTINRQVNRDNGAMSRIHAMPGLIIRRLHQISMSLFQARIEGAGHDLTSVQFAALVTLRDHPGIDQATLAGHIAYDRVTMGGVLDRLVDKGLVTRVTSPRDRRARVLSLTPEGARVLAAVEPLVEDLQDEILGDLSAEEATVFLTLANRLAEAGNDLSRAPLRKIEQN